MHIIVLSPSQLIGDAFIPGTLITAIGKETISHCRHDNGDEEFLVLMQLAELTSLFF